VVVSFKDRLTRTGFNFFENLFKTISEKQRKEKILNLLSYITGKVFNADAIGSYNILRKDAKPLIDKLSRAKKLKINQLEKVTCESLKEITGRKTSWANCKVVVSFL